MTVRKNISIFFRKWCTSVDIVSVLLIASLLVFGIYVSITSTIPFAIKRNMPELLLTKHHFVMSIVFVALTFFITLLSSKQIQLLSFLCCIGCLFLLCIVLVAGTDIKGAKRWIKVFGFSLQPSELLKPVISVIVAYLLSLQYRLTCGVSGYKLSQSKNSGDVGRDLGDSGRNDLQPYLLISIIVVGIASFMLIRQPDFGMTFVTVSSYVVQLFVAGISFMSIIVLACIAFCMCIMAYIFLPHVRARVLAFLDGGDTGGMSYQLKKSLSAIHSGGLWGSGAGNGVVKYTVPDMHSDFVFSVIAEEFGVIVCLTIFTAFVVIIVRSIILATNTKDMFRILLVSGLSTHVLLQVFINISSSVGLIPTKGITLPFFSYGGSSLLSAAMSFGLILWATKRSDFGDEL